ncbi:XRE family transcriptional regulator [Terrilactibacillus sp. S3-3]|nr:XRE family transcriptional regulator [Terrilactibacillus sp. S3-3]
MLENQKDETKHLTKQVGLKLRRVRKQNHLSLEELSQKISVSKLTLGKIERGDANPTLAILWKITSGLSIPLATLLNVEDKVQISRQGQSGKLLGNNESFIVEPAFNNLSYGNPEIHRAYLKPHAEHTEIHSEGTLEIVTVLSGNIKVIVDGESYQLYRFDAMRFQGDNRHTYINDGNEQAILQFELIYTRNTE